jgi:hypothetical protein
VETLRPFLLLEFSYQLSAVRKKQTASPRGDPRLKHFEDNEKITSGNALRASAFSNFIPLSFPKSFVGNLRAVTVKKRAVIRYQLSVGFELMA